MIGASLRLRLLAVAAAWVLAALLITGAALLYLFTANVERTVHSDLSAGLDRLVSLTAAASPALEPAAAMADPRYGVPFSGLYWQIEDPATGVMSRSRSLWDVFLDVPDGAYATTELVTIRGVRGGTLASLSRELEVPGTEGSRLLRFTTAQDRRILDESISRFGREMAFALFVVAAALLMASWLQIQLGLAPLKSLTAGIEAIRRGRAERLAGDFPAEVQPLVRETNDLLAARERSLESARTRAADLAHGLKTPLSVMSATAGRLREAGDHANADLIEALGEEMSDRVDYQLRLARLRLRMRSEVLSSSLTSALLRTVSVLRKTREGETLFWQMDLGAEVSVDIDRHDLLELVGIILENATQWADTLVDVGIRQADGFAIVTIADDGPGLTDKQIAQIGVRGKRLDENRPGSGFGLAIAGEILTLNAGELDLSRSDRGGLLATIRLPVARA